MVCCPSTLSVVQWSHTYHRLNRYQQYKFHEGVVYEGVQVIFFFFSQYIYVVKGNSMRNSSWLLWAPMCYKSKPIIHNILGSRFVIYELSPVQLYWVFFANNLRVLPSIFGSWERERVEGRKGMFRYPYHLFRCFKN